jgi:hypothetical protein
MSTHLGDAPKKVNDTRKCRRHWPNNTGQDFHPESSRISQTPGIRAPKPSMLLTPPPPQHLFIVAEVS